MSAARYLGFAQGADGAVLSVYGDDPAAPARVEPTTLAALAPHERRALELDRSPALYHWNDLLHLAPDGALHRVYARGKDFVPFTALAYAEALRARLADPELGPLSIQIQPNQVCNDACTFCCTEDYRQKDVYRGRRYSRGELLGLVEQLAARGVQVVEIIGGGEPTLHPDLVAALWRIAELGMKAYLFTNGSRFNHPDLTLNEPLLEAIAAACCIVTVSLDGYRRRQLVHRRIEPERTEATFRAMEHLHRIRDPHRLGFYNSYILTGGAQQDSNVEDLYDCVARQSGWVDALHVQNDFVSLSHRELPRDTTAHELQRTVDDFFGAPYLYLNYPLIAGFALQVPYDLSLHNVPSSAFPWCGRALLAPTVECGSHKLWPCGKYAGEAGPGDRHDFASFGAQLRAMRASSDFKGGMSCDPCINSSYNQSLLAMAPWLDRPGALYHFYERGHVERTLGWPQLRRAERSLSQSA